MRLRILPESFITNECSITNTHKSLICSSVLDKFKDTILDSPGGCIFKLTFQNVILDCECIEFVECVEFTAPANTIIIPNQLFDSLLIDFENDYYLDLDIFVPPQATRVNFKIENEDIFNNPDVKGFLENGIEKVYKFLYEGQILNVGGIKLIVDQLEPYSICLISNTDLEVDFECPLPPEPKPEPKPEPEPKLESSPQNELPYEHLSPVTDKSETPMLTRDELRKKRLEFYDTP